MCGPPGEIRTPDTQVRSLVLYPAELRAEARSLGSPLKKVKESGRQPAHKQGQAPKKNIGYQSSLNPTTKGFADIPSTAKVTLLISTS